MGLDIVALTKLKEVENPSLDENGYVVNSETEWKPGESMKWSEKYYAGRAEGLDADTVYSYDFHFCFRAGSYSGYNYWRSLLEKFKGDVGFQELIHFADNEGVIGPVVSKKLYGDFKKYEKEAEAFSKTFEDGVWFLDKYKDWLSGFELASNNGAVIFC